MDKSPSQVLAEELRKTRERRGWTQQALADRLEEIDLPIDRSTIAKIEANTRGVSVDEVLAFAIALGVPPMILMVPRSEDKVRVAPGVKVGSWEAAAWWRGVFPLDNAISPEDRRFFDDACSDAEATVRTELPAVFEIWRNAELALAYASVAIAEQGANREGAVRSAEQVLTEIRDDAVSALRKIRKLAKEAE